MRLSRLSDDELLALIARVTSLFTRVYGGPDVTAEEMRDFLYFMLARAGADTMITPREIIRAYFTALGIVLQSSGAKRLPDVYKKEGAVSLGIPENSEKTETKRDDFDPEMIEI